MSNSLNIFLLLLVAYSITLSLARYTDDLSARLKALASDPANDERFNEINDVVDIDEFYFPKRKEMSEKFKNTLPHIDVSTTTSDENEERSRGLRVVERGLLGKIVTSMFNLMGSFLR